MSNAHLALALLVLLIIPLIGRVREGIKQRRQYRQMMRRYGHRRLAASLDPPRAAPIEPAQY